jgi:hypothetical protein
LQQVQEMPPRTLPQGQEKGQSARVRLGVAEYVWTGPNPFARMLYLQAVSYFVPEALLEAIALLPDDDAGLLAWARRRGWEDSWALDAIRAHLPIWREQPDAAGSWVSISGQAQWVPMLAPRAWDITWESEAAFRGRVERYIDEMKRFDVVSRTPEKSPRHFEWAAFYQVGGLAYAQIQARDTDPPEISSISEGVTHVASLIGLTLRKPRLGRPRKSSDR